MELRAGWTVMVINHSGEQKAHVLSGGRYGRHVGDVEGIPQSSTGTRDGEILKFLQAEAKKYGLQVSQDRDSFSVFHVEEKKIS